MYRLLGVDPEREERWTSYAMSLLAFSVASGAALYGLLRLQGSLPLNPTGMTAVSPAVAFNTAASFMTNTSWQAYGGESTLSHLSQMAGLTVQNFVSAAAGMAILVAIVRNITRRGEDTLGNFWVDLTRTVVRFLVPDEPTAPTHPSARPARHRGHPRSPSTSCSPAPAPRSPSTPPTTSSRPSLLAVPLQRRDSDTSWRPRPRATPSLESRLADGAITREGAAANATASSSARSHTHDARLDTTGPKERSDIGVVAGQDRAAWRNQQGNVGIDEVRRIARSKQLADSPGDDAVQGSDVHPGKNSSEVRLTAAIAPNLCDSPRARVHRDALSLEHPEHRTDGAVTPVDGDQGAGVENSRHAAPRRRAVVSAAAAAFSSSSLNGPSSASQ